MPGKLTVVVSQGQSADPRKRALEEAIVAALLFEKGFEVAVIPHLYDLQPDGTGMLCLRGISGDFVLLSWLYSRAAHWVLDRNGIRGHVGRTLLGEPDQGEDEDDEGNDGSRAGESKDAAESETNGEPADRGIGGRNLPNRTIYCLDLRWRPDAQAFVDEIARLAVDTSTQTFSIGGLLGSLGGGSSNGGLVANGNSANGAANGASQQRLSAGGLPIVTAPSGQGNGHAGTANGTAAHAVGDANGAATSPAAAVGEESASAPSPLRIEEPTQRRWYPVIDFSRCTNCMECLDFCLFGVYGVDRFETILVQQPDNCRKGCPACSRVCPEHAILFPQHKTPGIAGAPETGGGGFKIDLSKLFGAPDSLETAVSERDAELVAAGRDAVGTSVGLPKRRAGQTEQPKDDLDDLLDALDGMDL